MTRTLPPKEVASLAGTKLENDSYDVLIRDTVEVKKPDGSLLLRYLPHATPALLQVQGRVALRDAAVLSRNRGAAAGEREYPKKKDGTRSKTDYSPPVESGVVGYLDRNARFPYCRLTAFGHAHAEDLTAALPLLRWISARFEDEVPERADAQRDAFLATSEDFRLKGTLFTTVTVNRNFQTAVHKDAGDLREGFGVMTAFGEGYRGGHLCFPEFRVAVDMREGGLLFADVHEWHGNVPMVPTHAFWERLSLVCYYREHMKECGSAEEELARAKHRKKGEPLRGRS